MPKRIPIAAAKRVAAQYGCRQVVIMAFDGALTHVVSYGTSTADCIQAARAGNELKRQLGFPAEMTQTKPARQRRQEAKPK